MSDDQSVPGRPRPHRLLLAGGLFLLAPLVGEFLFGNQAITALPGIVMLAPLYGAGALLIREVARRTGRGWPTIVLLAIAYGLFEEGPVDQMLWNPNYGGFEFGAVYAGTHVTWLGTSVQLLQDTVTLHTVWSICVPIALVEAFDRGHPRPWLGVTGLTITSVVLVSGSALLAFGQFATDHFVATPGQFAGATGAIVGLLVLAFVVGRRPGSRAGSRAGSRGETMAPSPWVVAAVALGASSLAVSREYVPEEAVSPWLVAAGWLVLVGLVVALVLRWSRGVGWGAAHRVALAGGALLTYVWLGFAHAIYLDVTRATALLGNFTFGLAAILLLVSAWRSADGHP